MTRRAYPLLVCWSVLVLVGVSAPFQLRGGPIPIGEALLMTGRWYPLDLAVNFLLLFPVGLLLGLRGRGLAFIVATALIASGGIEYLQTAIVKRYPSIQDIFLNVLGAAAGALVAPGVRGWVERAWESRFRLFAAALCTLILWAVAGPPLLRPGAHNWEPWMLVLTGDEVGGKRRFHGTVHEATLYAGAHDEAVLPQKEPAWHLSRDGGGRAFRDVVERIDEADAFTLHVDVTPADQPPRYLARIVSISGSHSERNLTLGQEGNRFHLRLRTRLTGPNGVVLHRGPAPWTSPPLPQHRFRLHLAYDGEFLEPTLDGKPFGGRRRLVPTENNLQRRLRVGPQAWIGPLLLAMGTLVVALVAARPGMARWAFGLAVAAGVVAEALQMWIFGRGPMLLAVVLVPGAAALGAWTAGPRDAIYNPGDLGAPPSP